MLSAMLCVPCLCYLLQHALQKQVAASQLLLHHLYNTLTRTVSFSLLQQALRE